MAVKGVSVGSVLDLESILSQELGGVSWYQVRAVMVCALAMAIASLSVHEFVFTTARIDCRCLIPECEESEATEFRPPWLNYTIPSNEGVFESCQRFANTSITDPSFISTREPTPHQYHPPSSSNSNWSPEDELNKEICDSTLFTQDIIQCEMHVYASPKSVVKDYDLCCFEWLRSLLGSARTVGALLSLSLSGMVSDRFGRRTTLALVCFNTAIIGLTRYFITSYIGHAISVFAESLLGGGAIVTTAYILGVEMVSTENRLLTGNLLISATSLGQVPLALLAWATPTWRVLTLVIYAPQLLTLTFLWILPESVRWNLSQHRYKEVEKVLNKIAKSSGKQLSEKTSAALRKGRLQTEEEESKTDKNYKKPESKIWAVEDMGQEFENRTSGQIKESDYDSKTGSLRIVKELEKNPEEQVKKEPWLLVVVFRHKPILLRCIIVPVWWITLIFVYFGLSINAAQISGNMYLNFIAVALIDIPGQFAAYFLIQCAGRKPVLVAFYWICSLCQVAYIFLPAELYELSLTVYLVGKMAISGVGAALYVYTAELFPTPHRHRLFAFCSMVGRLGSIISPLTPALGATVWVSLPFVLFASMALLSGLLVLLCPETRGCPLPHTMEQAAHMGRPSNLGQGQLGPIQEARNS